MEYYKNLSLRDISEIIDGVLYVEEWRDIKGYEGYYQVSNFGRIKSLKREINKRFFKCWIQERILRQHFNKGYLIIALNKEGTSETARISRLVGIHFIDNPEGKPEVNHKKGIKTDNRAISLEWFTPSEQQIHRYRILLQKHPMTGRIGKLSSAYGKFKGDAPGAKKIFCCTLNMSFNSIRDASTDLGISPSEISRVINGHKLSVYGLNFRIQ